PSGPGQGHAGRHQPRRSQSRNLRTLIMAKAAAVTKQAKKVTFTYEGTDRKGSRIKGEVLSTNPALARAELRKQGINVRRVRKKSEFTLGGKKTIKPADIAV